MLPRGPEATPLLCAERLDFETEMEKVGEELNNAIEAVASCLQGFAANS